jgi:DNA-binding PadR family transcriptional regulator
MSTRLVILGLLRQQPLHGYELKHIIEEHMGDWTNIAFGSIYFALKKLSEEGFVEQAGIEQQGNRPSRMIYKLTAAGRQEFMRLLRETWRELERHYYAIDIGLAFMDALPLEEVTGYLEGRVAALEEVVQHISDHREEQMARPEMPRQAAAVFDHSLAHFQAELSWTRSLLDKVGGGNTPK